MSVWTKLYEVYPKIEMDKGNKDARDIDKFLLQDGLSINNAGLEITLDSVGNVVNIFLALSRHLELFGEYHFPVDYRNGAG